MWRDITESCPCGCGSEEEPRYPGRWFFPWSEEWTKHHEKVKHDVVRMSKSMLSRCEPRVAAFLRDKEEHLDYLMKRMSETDRQLREGVVVHTKDELFIQHKSAQLDNALCWIQSRVELAKQVMRLLFDYGWLMSEEQKAKGFEDYGLNKTPFPHCGCKYECTCGAHVHSCFTQANRDEPGEKEFSY